MSRDLAALGLPVPTLDGLPGRDARAKKLPRHRPGGEFLRGPIPLTWLSPAACLPGKALAVGLALWFEAGRKRTRQVRLTGPILRRFSVERRAAYRALGALERAGLVSVKRQVGKNPALEILDWGAS